VSLTPKLATAVDALRGYLDRIGFSQIFKFVAGMNQYTVTPSLVTSQTAGDWTRFFDTVLGRERELSLAQCLMSGRPASRSALSEAEKPVADALVEANLLRPGSDGDAIESAGTQLISAFGADLLIDRRIHFGGGGLHDVYIGPDSYWMLYYIDVNAIRRDHRAVDLCTGTGIAALYLSLFSDHVLATDIGDAPLVMADINRRLNRREATVEIRRQDLRETVDGPDRFDVLTCNPPFVAFPPGYDGTLYAHGTGADGLGYIRMIVERLPSILAPGSSAYLVADLVGDRRRPHFVAELEEYAASGSMTIDVYIDNVIPASLQVPVLSAHLESLNLGSNRVQIAAEFTAFQRDTLRAERYYMSTLRLRTASPNPGVRVMQRCAPVAEAKTDPWTKLLLAN
jgi:methylase of polypeptide subunit release factors